MNANAQAEAGQDGEAEQFLLLKITERGEGFGCDDERRPQCVPAALQSAIRWFGGRHAHTVATKAPGP